MRRSTALMSQFKLDSRVGETLRFEHCKGGYFSKNDELGLKVMGRCAQNGTPTPDQPVPVQFVKAGTKIICGSCEIVTPCDLYDGDTWYPMSGRVERSSKWHRITNVDTCVINKSGTAYKCRISLPDCKHRYQGTVSNSYAMGDVETKFGGMVLLSVGYYGEITVPIECNTVEAANEWLADRNVYMYYVSRVTTVEQYDPRPIFAPCGLCNITQETDGLSATLSASMLVKKGGIYAHVHKFLEYELISSGTCCSSEQYRYRCRCGECSETVFGEYDYTNHTSEVSYIPEIYQTCITEGFVVPYWPCCGIYEYENMVSVGFDPENHEGTSALIEESPSTCVAHGQKVYEWSCCKKKDYEQSPLDPYNHDWSGGRYEYEEYDGDAHTEVIYCGDCGNILEFVGFVAHTWDESYKKCTVCGYEYKAGDAHTCNGFGDKYYTQYTAEEHVESIMCSLCGELYDTPVRPHRFDSDGKCVDCGYVM